MASGGLMTMLLPETAGKTLEELSLEDSGIIEDGTVEYVVENGEKEVKV